MSNRCENPKHEGNPTENLGKGTWWLKDPEWLMWCPNCTSKNFKNNLANAFEHSASMTKHFLKILKKEFYKLECLDEIKTSQGIHQLWTPADVALSKAYNEVVEKTLGKFVEDNEARVKRLRKVFVKKQDNTKDLKI